MNCLLNFHVFLTVKVSFGIRGQILIGINQHVAFDFLLVREGLAFSVLFEMLSFPPQSNYIL